MDMSPQDEAAVYIAKMTRHDSEQREVAKRAARKPIDRAEPAADQLTEMTKGSSALAKLRPHVEHVMSRDGVSYEVALGKVASDPVRYADKASYRRETR